MTNFVQHLIARHAQAVPVVQPRNRGRYEPESLTDNGPAFPLEAPMPTAEPTPTANIQQPIEGIRQPPPAQTHELKQAVAADPRPVPDSLPTTRSNAVAPTEWPTFTPLKSPANFPSADVPEEVNSPLSNRTANRVRSIDKEPSAPREITPNGFAAASESAAALPNRWLEQPAATSPAILMPERITPTQAPIEVTIGRIEVRAIMPAAPAAATPAPTKSKPRLSLEDYLKQRNAGR